ncbi:MAG TPA: 16S rRNA (adenine(1518)-N(6)/adenine(1519)-N(6))-dimethyltransferase RsmA [Planctomycetota bacterium]|nr:16S rRNA (adenine(1518)-N(6)/adenine(1519)-N(6))-dimethyltransferase RsmA [Planctomycetota bacterium]
MTRPRGDDAAAEIGGSPGIFGRLRAAGLLPRKVLGQHFLHDPRLLGAIVEDAGVTASDSVLEVGAGPGTLTREIAMRAGRVLAVDLDGALLDFARRELAGFDNIRFLNGDVLERGRGLSPLLLAELKPLEPFLWVSNLPYNIATTLIVCVCESGLRWERSALTVQSEVANRLAAGPGEKAYGQVSALLSFWARASAGRKIPPGAFWPPPRVQSRVVLIERRESPLGAPEEYGAYRAWVKTLFASRRKQVQTVLRRLVGEAGAQGFLSKLPDPRARAESLGPADFLSLARHFPAFSR